MRRIIDIPDELFAKLIEYGEPLPVGNEFHDTLLRSIAHSIPYEDKWLPVSERLPDKDGEYEVTRAEYVPSKPDHHTFDTEGGSHWDLVVDIAKFETQRINEYNNGFDKAYKVIAWRSPEPYKVEGEEQ